MIFAICKRKKINLEVSCKRYRFGYLDSCKCLPNFVNVAALYMGTPKIVKFEWLQESA